MFHVTLTALRPQGTKSTEGKPSFSDFCHREFPRLVGTLTLYLGGSDAAEELAQEALVRAFQRWKRVSRLDNPGGWVNHVAINLANSHWRRTAAERRARTRLAEEQSDSRETDDLVAVLAVRSAVARLPRRERTVVVLRHFVGLSVAEVAELLHCPEGTIKRLTHNGIQALKESAVLEDFKEDSHA